MKSVLIGYGYWGKIIEKYLRNHKYFNLIGIYDPLYEESLKIEEILDETIECAFVCTPIDFHYSTVKLLLKKGKHVFCEKPLCKSIEETEELINLAKNKQICLFTDYIYTSSPSINFIKQNINSLGKIFYCEGNINQFGKFYKNDDVFEVLAVHMISAISYILNSELTVKNVVSKKENISGIIEVGSFEFETKNGIKGIVNSSLLDREKERKIIFRCESGNIIFDMLNEKTVSIIYHIENENGYVEKILKERKYDESSNIKIALENFKKNINKKSSNEQVTLSVARTLEGIKNLVKKEKN